MSAPDLTDDELAWLALFLQASPAKRAALLRLATTLAELLPDGPPREPDEDQDNEHQR